MYEAMGAAVGAFSSAAAFGQVSIEADAAADALSKIGKVKAELETLFDTSSHGSAELALGANPVGRAMAEKSSGRYDGPDSFMAAVKLLLDQTEKAEHALKKCIDNYVDTDSAHAGKLGRTN